MKTNELTGAALDWAVATANGDYPQWDAEWQVCYAANGDNVDYSTDWAQGGPIIEREGIGFFQKKEEDYCQAAKPGGEFVKRGPTPLIAAMRCYVASKLGDEVEIPEELMP
jgi:Protein of unknown function (DUF2591)